MTKKPIHLHVPMLKPEDVIPHLGKGELHWKKGHSAQELAISWFEADEIPKSVRSVLNTCPDYADVSLVDAFFERDVDLKTRGRPSQTDLMAVVSIESGLAIIAIEAKVEEPFGNLVKDWNDGSPGKTKRLGSLCKTLGLDSEDVGGLRYQLLHRTASAIYEAQRYQSSQALMLVQSFSDKNSWFDDFRTFAAAMGQDIENKNSISAAKQCERVWLRLGWCADSVRP